MTLLRLNLCGEGKSWYLHLKTPEALKSELTVDEPFEMFDRHMLAQNSVVRLAEGETFDIGFWPDQSDSFMFYDLDEPDPVIYVIANRIYVEDSAGRRYRVKNDARCIDRLFDGEPT